jgi:hypothetical protein
MKRAWASLCLLLPQLSWGYDEWVNPGTMGPNALPSVPGESPRSDGPATLRLAAAGQQTFAGDLSVVPWYRLETPFRKWITVISEGRTFEFWTATRQTQEAFGLSQSSGIERGDLSFGVKFLLFDGGPRWPSVGFRNLTKSTTGKGLARRRFINAPAYLLDFLFSQPLGTVANLSLEMWASAGLYVWQQGTNGQNDAFAWSSTLLARTERGSSLMLGVRGFQGWQAYDKALVLTASGEWAFSKHVGGLLTLNAGVRDAPRLELMLGLTFRFKPHLPLSVSEATNRLNDFPRVANSR